MAYTVILRQLFLISLAFIVASSLETGSALDAQKNVKNFDVLEDLVAEKKLLQDEIQMLQGLQANVRTINVTDFRPVDCADLLMAGFSTSGVYSIYPFTCSCSRFIQVYCDMDTDGGGWTVLLKREAQHMQENFNRSWPDYRQGFGSPYGEYYIGNEYIHKLTTARPYIARFDWLTTTGVVGNIMYDSITVDDENSRYQLDLGNKMAGSSTTYNCYSYNDGKYFSTYERDSDASASNCANIRGGGFWYHYCYLVNPPTGRFDHNMNITCYRHNYENQQVTRFQMKIRPSLCESTYRRITYFNNPCNDN